MITSQKQLNSWLLFFTGILIGTMFCMKMLEPHFVHNGKLFTIIGIEMVYNEGYFISLLSGLESDVLRLLKFHLYADFVFMAGVYPAIAVLCLKARLKHSVPFLRNLLLVLALLQAGAWICDILENLYILRQLNKPVSSGGFGVYHFVVWTKWLLALAGLFTALILMLKRKRE